MTNYCAVKQPHLHLLAGDLRGLPDLMSLLTSFLETTSTRSGIRLGKNFPRFNNNVSETWLRMSFVSWSGDFPNSLRAISIGHRARRASEGPPVVALHRVEEWALALQDLAQEGGALVLRVDRVEDSLRGKDRSPAPFQEDKEGPQIVTTVDRRQRRSKATQSSLIKAQWSKMTTSNTHLKMTTTIGVITTGMMLRAEGTPQIQAGAHLAVVWIRISLLNINLRLAYYKKKSTI